MDVFSIHILCDVFHPRFVESLDMEGRLWDLSICGFWYPPRVLEPIPHRYQGTTVLWNRKYLGLKPAWFTCEENRKTSPTHYLSPPLTQSQISHISHRVPTRASVVSQEMMQPGAKSQDSNHVVPLHELLSSLPTGS